MKNFWIFWMTCWVIVLGTSCTEEVSETQEPETSSEITYEGSAANGVQSRQVWQKPNLVIELLGDLQDKTIADIGAGVGYFSFRLAEKAKRVIAIEIDESLLQTIDELKKSKMPEEFQDRLETRLTTPESPGLKKGEADVVLLVNTYIYIENRVAYLKQLLDVLEPNDRLVIVDFKKKRIGLDKPLASERLPLYQVENELIEAGFTIQRSDDCSLDYQYIILAMK